MKGKALLVKDVMSKDTFFIHPDTSITQCVLGLAQHKLPGAPVADLHGRLIGFVSEQDILPALVQSVYYSDEPKRVKDVMQHNVLTASPNDNVMQIAKLMMESKPKVYPVIEDGRIIGIITRRLITTALIHSQKKCVPV